MSQPIVELCHDNGSIIGLDCDSNRDFKVVQGVKGLLINNFRHA